MYDIGECVTVPWGDKMIVDVTITKVPEEDGGLYTGSVIGTGLVVEFKERDIMLPYPEED